MENSDGATVGGMMLGIGSSGLGVTSSSATSRSQVRLKSSDALRNSLKLLPNDRLNCGSLRGPNTIRATTKMTISSVVPKNSKTKRYKANYPPFDRHEMRMSRSILSKLRVEKILR